MLGKQMRATNNAFQFLDIQIFQILASRQHRRLIYRLISRIRQKIGRGAEDVASHLLIHFSGFFPKENVGGGGGQGGNVEEDEEEVEQKEEV